MVKDSSQTIKSGYHYSEMENKSIDELVIILREFERHARQIRKEINRRFPAIASKFLSNEFKTIVN
jgi:5S rRNA maturation endonuclease (ribonuclease M5)